MIQVAAGLGHALALQKDGRVWGWGANTYGQATVPTDLPPIQSVAAGARHSLAATRDGRVIAWGDNSQGQCRVPAALRNVVSVAAGEGHSVALTGGGRVVVWGNNDNLQRQVPRGLSAVTAIAAGSHHTLALRANGTVVAWGARYNTYALPNGLWGGAGAPTGRTAGPVVPKGLNDVVEIAASNNQCLARRRDGSLVEWAAPTWKVNMSFEFPSQFGWTYPQVPVPVPEMDQPPLRPALAMAIGGGVIWTLGTEDLPSWSARTGAGATSNTELELAIWNTAAPRIFVDAGLDGPDADSFSIVSPLPVEVDVNGSMTPYSPFTTNPTPSVLVVEIRTWVRSLRVRFTPTSSGHKTALLHLWDRADPSQSYTLLLEGDSPSSAGVDTPELIAGPLRFDRITGSVLQSIRFENRTTDELPGLRLTASHMAPGASLLSAQESLSFRAAEVDYTLPIPAGGTAVFDLCYQDPRRRIKSISTPNIYWQPLFAPVSPPGPVTGAETRLLQCITTPQGPLLEWASVKNGLYVVEYSDDGAATWYSAMHLLRSPGTRMRWIDRGQPETKTKTTGKPNQPGGRYYRVKQL